jgi:hypothetical protein
MKKKFINMIKKSISFHSQREGNSMKKGTTIVLFSVIAIEMMMLSGCTNQTTNNNSSSQQTIHDEFTTNSTGGTYELGNRTVTVTVPQQAVSQQLTITLDSVPDPPYQTDVTLTDCYSFGPNGTVFSSPITLRLPYTPSEIPSTVLLGNLSLFILSGTQWQKINGSYVDTIQHTVTGTTTHFCLIGAGFIPPEKAEHTTTHNDSQKNNSAIITFEVHVQTYHYETNITLWPDHPDDIDYTYYSGAYISWDPQPYVRYYTVTNHFNGNQKPFQTLSGSCEFRDWGKEWCPRLPYADPDNMTVFLGPAELVPNPNHLDYRGLYTIGSYLNGNPVVDGSKHGKLVYNIYDKFDNTEHLTRGQINAVEQEMDAFVTSYIEGWTYTVEPFT